MSRLRPAVHSPHRGETIGRSTGWPRWTTSADRGTRNTEPNCRPRPASFCAAAWRAACTRDGFAVPARVMAPVGWPDVGVAWPVVGVCESGRWSGLGDVVGVAGFGPLGAVAVVGWIGATVVADGRAGPAGCGSPNTQPGHATEPALWGGIEAPRARTRHSGRRHADRLKGDGHGCTCGAVHRQGRR